MLELRGSRCIRAGAGTWGNVCVIAVFCCLSMHVGICAVVNARCSFHCGLNPRAISHHTCRSRNPTTPPDSHPVFSYPPPQWLARRGAWILRVQTGDPEGDSSEAGIGAGYLSTELRLLLASLAPMAYEIGLTDAAQALPADRGPSLMDGG